MNKVIMLLFILFSFLTERIIAQETKVKKIITITAGGGISFYCNKPGLPLHIDTDVNRFSPSASVRVMLHPGHHLRFGLESGYCKLYSYTFSQSDIKGSVRITSIPLLIVWSMPFGKHLNLFAGSGNYFLQSHLDFDGHVNSGMLSLGWMAAASYLLPLNNKLNITPEVKWFHAAETNDQTINLQLLLAWNLFEWQR
jgi:hypothetical protein